MVRPRIIVGGDGKPRSMRIAAKYADEFNLSSARPETAGAKYAALAETCRAAGRDPATMARSAMAGVLIGANEREVAQREKALLEALEVKAGGGWLEERKTRWVVGTPDEARAMLARFAEAGVERIMLQDFVPRDLRMIELMGRELVGRA
jgi:alkanesulfonate monooxygenase SsuD/methylene tetrahydromethanopterin reductase-like flavin-dependent oxidoreductase (luciferase family)